MVCLMGFIRIISLVMQVFWGATLGDLTGLHALPRAHQPGGAELRCWRGTDGLSQGLSRACVSMERCPGR